MAHFQSTKTIRDLIETTSSNSTSSTPSDFTSTLRDNYGYAVPDYMHDEYIAFQKSSETENKKRLKKYKEIFDYLRQPYFDLTAAQMFREGIPPQMRRIIWLQVSGVGNRIRRAPGRYANLIHRVENNSATSDRQITIDLGRTFGTNNRMSNAQTESAMFNVLRAYARHNESVGYCQSMAFLVSAMFLLDFTEEEAFWMLDHLLSMMPNCYDETLSGTLADAKVLDYYIEKKLPKLHGYLRINGVDVNLFAPPMLMCLFVGYVPFETMFRVWDRIMYNGILELFRSALKFLNFIQEKVFAETHGRHEEVEISQCITRNHRLLVDADAALAIMPGKQNMEHGQLQLRRMRYRQAEVRIVNNDDDNDPLEEVPLHTTHKTSAEMEICDIDDQ